jgi:hypothetical protein
VLPAKDGDGFEVWTTTARCTPRLALRLRDLCCTLRVDSGENPGLLLCAANGTASEHRGVVKEAYLVVAHRSCTGATICFPCADLSFRARPSIRTGSKSSAPEPAVPSRCTCSTICYDACCRASSQAARSRRRVRVSIHCRVLRPPAPQNGKGVSETSAQPCMVSPSYGAVEKENTGQPKLRTDIVVIPACTVGHERRAAHRALGTSVRVQPPPPTDDGSIEACVEKRRSHGVQDVHGMHQRVGVRERIERDEQQEPVDLKPEFLLQSTGRHLADCSGERG